jgi:hypothetical protein
MLGCGDNVTGPAAAVDAAPGAPDAEPVVDAGPVVDRSGELFRPDQVLDIRIDLAPADWETLRFQLRDVFEMFGGADCQESPWGSPYTYFPATVTIDGEQIDNVGVRKKGFFGSVTPARPSLKLNLDYYVPGQRHLGVEDITLNNGSNSDRHFLLITQCLGYQIFSAAGMPASRCNFAHVTVNGQDMGIYAHVERVRKSMLSRHFDDGSGVLWEGAISDFTDAFVGTFEQKNQEETPYNQPLVGVVSALALPDAELPDALAQVIDVDQFMRYWALEALVGHWDGYSGNRNNFYVYEEPVSGLLHFMPWGIDGIFNEPIRASDRVALARGELAKRLYGLPLMRARYLAAISAALDTVWDEEALIAEVDRMESLLLPFVVDDPTTPVNERTVFTNRNRDTRLFINNRRGLVTPLISSPPAAGGALIEDWCREEAGTFTASFSTTWQNLANDPFANGSTASASGDLDGNAMAIDTAGAVAGLSNDAKYPNGLRVATTHSSGFVFAAAVRFKNEAAMVNRDIDVNWYYSRALLADGNEFFQGSGTVRFSALDRSPGGTVTGTMTLKVWR